jgi:hypothetical protein
VGFEKPFNPVIVAVEPPRTFPTDYQKVIGCVST